MKIKSQLKKQIDTKKKKITDQAFIDQDERAKKMAELTLQWMNKNGYGKPVKAWWTARAGVLSKAVGRKVDSTKNPTDVLVKHC